MRIIVILAILLTLSLTLVPDPTKCEKIIKDLEWLGQSAIRLTVESHVIYIDPYKLEKNGTADLILITHNHGDHLSLEDIKKIITPNTEIIGPASVITEIKSHFSNPARVIAPNQTLDWKTHEITAVPAYNIKKPHYHPKANQWVGYIINLNGVRIYHAGDTERIPEMKNYTCDIALIPLGQVYTMNSVQEAAAAALDVKAKVAIPIHYGLAEGSIQDAELFKTLLQDKIKIIIKEKQS
jgi:L-ascorbate metabolism protein UlaG (beta-lactamase superfamily)